MSADRPLVQATGFLHCNLNCRDLDRLIRFYEALLGLRVGMRIAGEGLDATSLGITGPTDSATRLLYDHRGGRGGPALEVIAWSSPATEGEVYEKPENAGLQAIGFTAPSLPEEAAVRAAGGSFVGDVTLPGGIVQRTVRDPDGVFVEVIRGESAGKPRARHIRGTCLDLERSSRWYERIGFRMSRAPHDERRPTSRKGATNDGAVRTAGLVLGDGYALELDQWMDPATAGRPYARGNHRGLYRMALAVEDVRAAYRALADSGNYEIEPPGYVPLPGTPIPGLWISFLRDPDGIVVELIERPRRNAI